MNSLGLWQWHEEDDTDLQFIWKVELIALDNRWNLGCAKGKSNIKYMFQIYVAIGSPINFELKKKRRLDRILFEGESNSHFWLD